MLAPLLTLVVSLTLVSSVNAGAPWPPRNYTEKICYTRVANSVQTRPIPTSTQYYTRTNPYLVIVKSTATETSTPPPITATSTFLTTSVVTSTASAMTETFTSITTPSTTLTSTNVQITTFTSVIPSTTIFTTTTTSTLSLTPSGYTPVATQLAALGKTYSRKRDVLKKNLGMKLSSKNGHLLLQENGGKAKDIRKYSKSVQCKVIVQEVVYLTRTAPAFQTTTVTAAPSTVTSTSTSVQTSTSVVPLPDVSTTVIISAAAQTFTDVISTTSTSTVFSTAITTNTLVIQAPAETYSPCTPADNYISKINNRYLGSLGTPGNFVFSSSASGLTCCQSCQQSAMLNPASCQAYAFFTGGGSNCIYFANGANYQVGTYAGGSKVDLYFGNAGGGMVSVSSPLFNNLHYSRLNLVDKLALVTLLLSSYSIATPGATQSQPEGPEVHVYYHDVPTPRSALPLNSGYQVGDRIYPHVHVERAGEVYHHPIGTHSMPMPYELQNSYPQLSYESYNGPPHICGPEGCLPIAPSLLQPEPRERPGPPMMIRGDRSSPRLRSPSMPSGPHGKPRRDPRQAPSPRYYQGGPPPFEFGMPPRMPPPPPRLYSGDFVPGQYGPEHRAPSPMPLRHDMPMRPEIQMPMGRGSPRRPPLHPNMSMPMREGSPMGRGQGMPSDGPPPMRRHGSKSSVVIEEIEDDNEASLSERKPLPRIRTSPRESPNRPGSRDGARRRSHGSSPLQPATEDNKQRRSKPSSREASIHEDE